MNSAGFRTFCQRRHAVRGRAGAKIARFAALTPDAGQWDLHRQQTEGDLS